MGPQDRVTPIKRCPERTEIKSEQNWYGLADAPGIKICSRCYHDHLANSPFGPYFGHEVDTSGAARYCDFNLPRMHAVLRQALSQNRFDVLRDYMIHRNQQPRCKGSGGSVNPDEGYRWFQLTDPNMAGKFGACSACYEDYVMPSGFAQFFASAPIEQPKDQVWLCDLGSKFSRGLFMSGGGNWSNVLGWAMHRQQLPKCGAGSEVTGASRMWFRARDRELANLWMCEACFYDLVPRHFADQHFEPSPHRLDEGMKLVCLAGGSIPLRVALDEAVKKNDWAIFHRGAHTFVRNPPCQAGGTPGGTWYSLIPAADQVDVCETCYVCIIQAVGLGHTFARKPGVAGETRLCDLHPSAPHAMKHYDRIDMAVDRDDPGIYTKFARRIADVPACPGGTPVTNRRWYTHDMFTCCPSCWLDAPIEGTALSSCFSPEVQVEGQLKCDFYSARVRSLWSEACANKDLDGFVAFMKRRLEIWQQTYPAIQQQLALMRMNAQRQSTLFMASVLNTGGNNIAAAAGVHGNYGNSSVGWGYETYAGAEGAVQFNQALNMNSSNMGPVAVIAQLEGLWNSVE